MDRQEAVQQLRFLYDQVHQTAERSEHLPERMPFHIHPQSLNYEKDLTRIEGEYNRLARTLQAEGVLTPAEFEAQDLPLHFHADEPVD